MGISGICLAGDRGGRIREFPAYVEPETGGGEDTGNSGHLRLRHTAYNFTCEAVIFATKSSLFVEVLILQWTGFNRVPSLLENFTFAAANVQLYLTKFSTISYYLTKLYVTHRAWP